MKKKNNKKVKKIPNNSNENEQTKKYKIKRKKHPLLWKRIRIAILVILLILIIFAGIFIGKIYGICKEAKLDMQEVKIKYENSIVKDISSETIAILTGDENRDPIKKEDMSEYLAKAFVAIEDERFYEHKGVDVKRTAAATITYILNGGESSFGGSTITQQMVKNLTEEDDRTWQRKVKEMARAYYIEQEMSKDQILELYLNLIFLGGRTYGVEVASQYYFSKSASNLTLAESAFLAGINNSPNSYSPFSTEQEDIDQIKKRTKTVIEKMYELGKENHRAGINQEEYETAMAEIEAGLAFNKGTIAQSIYSYHTEAAINQVKNDLKEKYGYTEEYADMYIKSGGLTIYTTQNSEIQNVMEEEVKKEKYITYSNTKKDEDGNRVTAQTAMVLIDHKTGYVLATVGGIGEKTVSFGQNRATQSVRQTGSSMKPLAVLCPGIENGTITAGKVYDDIPYSSGIYKGFKNYGYTYKGLTTVRYAIAASQNIPMLKAINDVGIQNSIDFLKSAGITTLDPEKDVGMSIALGGLENGVSPLQMAGAYAAIANDGVYIEPTFYTKVVDSDGNVILQTEQETRTIMSSATAYIVKEILTEVVRSGSGTYAAISGISVAAKTGTTSGDVDRWFCGFTPYYTAATWYGFDLNEEVVYNGNPAGKIWDGVMETIHKNLPSKTFSETRPSNVTTATICKCSGLLATDLCKNDPRGNQVYTEYFIKGTVPTESCTCHVSVDICSETGLLATEYCTARETKIFITRPETETGNWEKAADANYMLTIKDTCNVHVAPLEPITPVEPTTSEAPLENENNSSGGNNSSGNNTIGENQIGGNTTNGNETGNNTASGNETGNNTIGGNESGGNTSNNTNPEENTNTTGNENNVSTPIGML